MATRYCSKGNVFLDSSGNARNGGKLNFYITATTTRKNTYSDDTLVTPNTNPVVLDSSGRPTVDIFLLAADYKVVLTNSDGTDSITDDPVHGGLASLTMLDANLTSDQSVTNATWATVKFNNVLTDTLSAYSVSTGKYTPTISGKYLVHASCQGHCATTSTDCAIEVLKNGAHGAGTSLGYAESSQNTADVHYSNSAVAQGIVNCNGTTDTIEIGFFLNGTGGSNTVSSGTAPDGARVHIIYLGP